MFDFGKRKYYRFFTLGFWKALLFPPNPTHAVQYLPGDYRVNSLGVHEFKDMRKGLGDDRTPSNGYKYVSENGTEYATIVGLLATDTIESAWVDSDLPTIVNGQLNFDTIGEEYALLTVKRAGVVWAEYHCQETTGTDMFDSSGNDNHGVLENFTVSTFHEADINVPSKANLVGYGTKDSLAGVIVPLDPDGVPVVADCENIYTNPVPNNAKIVNANYVDFDGVDDTVVFGSSCSLEIGKSITMIANFNQITATSYFIGGVSTSEGIRYNGTDFLILIDGSSGAVNWAKVDEFVKWECIRNSASEYEIFINSVSIGTITLGTTNTLTIDKIGRRGTVSFPTKMKVSYFAMTGVEYNFATGYGTTLWNKVLDGTNGTLNGITMSSFYTNDDSGQVVPYNMRDGFSQGLYCSSAGTSYIESTTAYGTWEFNFKVSSAGNIFVATFIASTNDRVTAVGYDFVALGSTLSNEIRFREWNTGTASDLFKASNYFSDNVDYRIRIVRASNDGEFSVYIKGGVYFGWTLIVETWGSNPVIDNTHSSSNFFIIDNDASDTINNLTIDNEVINLHDFTDGTGTYEKLYIPALSDRSGNDVLGNPLTNPQVSTNPSKLYMNGSESEILNRKVPALFDADLEMKFLYGVEQITNGTFDSGISGWTVIASTIAYETDSSIGDKGCIEVVQTSSGGGIYQYLAVEIPANSKVLVRATFKCLVYSTNTPYRVGFRDTSGGYLFENTDEPATEVGHIVELDTVVTVGATNINRIYFSTNGAGATYLIDNLNIKIITDDTPYPIPYDEIDYDKYSQHRLFANAEEKAKRDMTLYDEEQAGDTLEKIKKFIEYPVAPVIVYTGSLIFNLAENAINYTMFT